MSSGSSLLRSPKWDALVALLDEVCRAKGLRNRSGRLSYKQLAHACGLSDGILYQWRRHQIRPRRAALEKVAAYAGQSLDPWLAAAGLEQDG